MAAVSLCRPPLTTPAVAVTVPYRAAANGKAVEQWVVMDSLGLLQQLGAIPSPA